MFSFLRSVSCVQFPVFSFLCVVSCVLFPVFNFLCCVSCVQFPVFSFQCSVSCVQFPVFSFLCSVSCVEFPVFSFLCSVSCVEFSVPPHALSIGFRILSYITVWVRYCVRTLQVNLVREKLCLVNAFPHCGHPCEGIFPLWPLGPQKCVFPV